MQQNNEPMLPLRNPNYTLGLVFTIPLCCYFIKNLELDLMIFSVLLKIKFRHGQISGPKLGIPMSKTVIINPCLYLEYQTKHLHSAQWMNRICMLHILNWQSWIKIWNNNNDNDDNNKRYFEEEISLEWNKKIKTFLVMI